MTQIPFSPDLLEKGYKLIYRNGERPDYHHVWPDGTIVVKYKGGICDYAKNGLLSIDGYESDFDLFLTPPEMYVGVYEGGFCTDVCYDLEWLENKAKKMHSAKLYRLVPVE